MQLTLRSQLIAGVAALGVSAIAVAPVAQPELLTAADRVSSAVSLTAFANPIAALADSWPRHTSPAASSHWPRSCSRPGPRTHVEASRCVMRSVSSTAAW